MIQPALIPRRNDYTDDFEEAWAAYPKRPGNPKRVAFRCYQQRLKQGYTTAEILEGIERYAEYCRASSCAGTQFVMMARTFLGPDLHFLEEWEAPELDPEWATLPNDDNKLWDFAKKHGLPNPGMMTFRQYRCFLQEKINERIARERGDRSKP